MTRNTTINATEQEQLAIQLSPHLAGFRHTINSNGTITLTFGGGRLGLIPRHELAELQLEQFFSQTRIEQCDGKPLYIVNGNTRHVFPGKLRVGGVVLCDVLGTGSTATINPSATVSDIPVLSSTMDEVRRFERELETQYTTYVGTHAQPQSRTHYSNSFSNSLGHNNSDIGPQDPWGDVSLFSNRLDGSNSGVEIQTSKPARSHFHNDSDYEDKDQGLQRGITVYEVFDLWDVKKGTGVTENGKAFAYAEIRGNLLRSPDKFVGEDIALHLTKNAGRAIRRSVPENFRSGLLLFFRASERLVACTVIRDEDLDPLLEMDGNEYKVSDWDIVSSIPAFAKLDHSKMATWQRDSYYTVISELLHGRRTRCISPKQFAEIVNYMQRKGKYSQADIDKVTETYNRGTAR